MNNDSNSFTGKVRSQYINENLENSKRKSYRELTEKDGLEIVLYKDLKKRVMKGYPVASDFCDKEGNTYNTDEFMALPKNKQKECDLRYYYLPHSHGLYVGTTGTGKTTGCIEPELRAISSQKNKPDLFLTDPKGELFDRNATHLRKNGYKLFILNFKDITHSDNWSPLFEVYELKQSAFNCGNDRQIRQGYPVGIRLFDEISLFDGKSYIEFDDQAFASEKSFKEYVSFKKDFLEAEIASLINQLASMFIKVSSEKDPTWEQGGQDLLKGIIHCMLEDSVDPNSGFTRDMMNLKTIQAYYQELRRFATDDERDRCNLRELSFMKNKSDEAISLMGTVFDNSSRTRLNYCGVFDTSMKDWFQGHIFALTMENTINLDLDQPFAIFVVTRDYEKSDFNVAGLFIDWVYRTMLERQEKKKRWRTVHFILDEFANIPEIRDFENKIATSRSRDIWFHLAVQSYKQIDLVYGEHRSVVIRDNCNSQIFLGAQNRETKEIFSGECGNHYIPTLSSKINPEDNSICQVPLVPVSELDSIEAGQIYMKRVFMPLIISSYVRSYICAQYGKYKNFNESDGLEKESPRMLIILNSPKYKFKPLFGEVDKPEKSEWESFFDED